jgi:hypothetical protein
MQRYFQRREDYEPPMTQADSPFHLFVVSCLKCQSVKLRVIIQYDEDSGATVYLFCPQCQQREKLN